ncbi:MAG: peptide chain release factor N(5)-glutamine methyltransferase [Bacteroidota bacterium]
MSASPTSPAQIHPHTPYPAQAWYRHIYDHLMPALGDNQECKSITTEILSHYTNYDFTAHICNTPLEADRQTLVHIQKALARIHQHEPLQYILGQTHFLTHPINLEKGIFIPRRETEEMVAYIIKKQHQPQSILDLCTGSGCIAIALKKSHPHSKVEALDIDSKALKVAQANAQQLDCPIHFFAHDLLRQSLPAQTWDLIVSNPPYIPLAEKNQLKPNVVDYEPHQALFVPDQNPLIFYTHIAKITQTHLAPNGYVYVEIHENLSQATAEIFQKIGLQKVTMHEDLQGKKRWISARK